MRPGDSYTGAGSYSQGISSSSVPMNVQQTLTDLQSRLQRHEEEIRYLKQQRSLLGSTPSFAMTGVASVSTQPRVENRWEFLCGRFQEYYPPVFEGGLDPFRAEQWMGMISSILDSMGLVGHDRVIYATYVLRDDAQTWWEIVSQTRDTFVMDWKEFRHLFNERYYCDAAKTAKMNEFLNLVKENATVTKYVNRFNGLAKFSFDMVPTDVARKEMFI